MSDQPEDYRGLEAVNRLTKDLKKAAQTLSRDEARYLVDAYYSMQGDRIRSGNQVKALTKSEEPHATLAWLAENAGVLERSIASALDTYGNIFLVGRWAKEIYGIGPIITAGLLAHIELEPWFCAVAHEKMKKRACTKEHPHGPRCTTIQVATAGQIWRFGGVDPSVTWEKKTKRPWNASLKTLFWKIGESFMKTSGRDEDVYGHVYVARKEYEIRRNYNGELSQQAREKLAKFNIGKTTDAYLWYSGCLTVAHAREIANAPLDKREGMARDLAGEPQSGLEMLPPAHIKARAQRYATKLFISHYHAVAFRDHFGYQAPASYMLTQAMGHAHDIPVPNWPFPEPQTFKKS